MEELRPLTTAVDDSRFNIPRKPLASEQTLRPEKTAFRDPSFERLPDDGHESFTEYAKPGMLDKLKKFPEHPWFFEEASCVVAVIALAAIVITLAIHQGRPLPQWPHLISINSLIAFFTAVVKATLLMPAAEGKLDRLSVTLD